MTKRADWNIFLPICLALAWHGGGMATAQTRPVDELADLFARACLNRPSPAASATRAADANGWLPMPEQSEDRLLMQGIAHARRTWRLDNIASANLRLHAVVQGPWQSTACRPEHCYVIADQLTTDDLEAAVRKRLDLGEPDVRETSIARPPGSDESLPQTTTIWRTPGPPERATGLETFQGEVRLAIAKGCPDSQTRD